ncbi:MAG: Do family serine endopeptidase [Hyphomonadaceae bacterium]|nr:Do family serine endopeptidase [Hyphomonadaceae bacterium]
MAHGAILKRMIIAAAAGLAAIAPASAQSRLPVSGFADLADRLTPTVVNIATMQRIDGVEEAPRFPRGSPLERFNEELEDGAPQATSLGSGFVVSADGVVVTNYHVIEGAETIAVIFQSGEQAPARILGVDRATDLAVLRVDLGRPLPFAALGDSDAARVGDLVLAIGNPFGLGGTVTSGIISARNRNIDAGRYDDFIQTDASINRGNSGGPLFNMRGEVIGVNTAIVSPTGASVGVGFAIPSAQISQVIRHIVAYGEVRRGWLGVRLASVTPEIAQRNALPQQGGAVITRITPDSPAARAGLRAGDVVVRFAGRAIADGRSLTRMVAEAEVGGAAPIDIVREGRRMTMAVTIARLREADPGLPAALSEEDGPRLPGRARSGRALGLMLGEIDDDQRQRFSLADDARGLIVLGVEDPANARAGLRAGDVIETLAAEEIETIGQAREIAETARAADARIVARIRRDGRITYRALRPAR